MRARCLVVLLACAQPVSRPPDAPDSRDRDDNRHYAIWFGGARVGTAYERERWSSDGVVLVRREEVRFLRETTPVTITTEIEISATAALVPRRVVWRQRGGTGPSREVTAVLELRGWVVDDVRALANGVSLSSGTTSSVGAATSRARSGLVPPGGVTSGAAASHARATPGGGDLDCALPIDAIPAELVPLRVRRDGHFAGTVFFAARGFVTGRGQVELVAPNRLVGRLLLDGGTAAEATIDIAADRSYTRVVDGEGVIAIRTTEALARVPFDPVDLVAATAVPIAGARRGKRILLDTPPLPPVPGQLARPTDDGLELVLSPQLGGGLPPEQPSVDRSREIAALVAEVRQRIEPDLGAGPVASASAATATKGDCTTYALAYAAHAERRSIPTRVVTGYRVDGSRLVRHRWAISWTGSAWIAIDAAFGAAPAGGDLIGLAVHSADDAGLVAGEAALAQVRAARWR